MFMIMKFLKQLSVFMLLFSGVPITTEQFHKETQTILLNSQEVPVTLLFDATGKEQGYKFADQTMLNNELFLKKVPKLQQLRDTVTELLKTKTKAELVPYYFQVLLWNLECSLQKEKEVANDSTTCQQVTYKTGMTAYDDYMVNVCNTLFEFEPENETPEINCNEAVTTYDLTTHSRVDGPFIFENGNGERLDTASNIRYRLYTDTEKKVAYDEGTVTEGASFYISGNDFDAQTYYLDLIAVQTNIVLHTYQDEQYFHWQLQDMARDMGVINVPRLSGSLQLQFLTETQRPLNQTQYTLENLYTGQTISREVNPAATDVLDDVLVGNYRVIYDVKNSKHRRQQVIENLQINHQQLTKHTAISKEIMGEIILEIEATNKDELELYHVDGTKKEHLITTPIVPNEQIAIPNLPVGEYQIKFNTPDFSNESTVLDFKIQQDTQAWKYRVTNDGHHLLAVTGEHKILKLIFGGLILVCGIVVRIVMTRKIKKQLESE